MARGGPVERSAITSHYAGRSDEDSQTAPEEVRNGLHRFLTRADLAGPALDVGTGIGGNLPAMRERMPSYGMELSASAATAASRRVAPVVVVADAAAIPFVANCFGVVVCTEVLEHVSHPEAVFAEMARVLRPDGLAYVTAPNYANLAGVHKLVADRRSGRHDWNPWGAHHGGHEAFMTGRRLRDAARPHFELVSARGLDYGQALTGRFPWLDRVAATANGQRVLRRVLPRLYSAEGVLAWHGMHIELVLRRRA